MARHVAHGGAPVGAAGMRGGLGAAGGDGLEQRLEPAQRMLGLQPFVRAHGVEIGPLQQLALAEGERGLDLDALRRRRGLRPRWRADREGLAQPAVLGRGRRGVGVVGLHLRQQHLHHAAGQVGVAPVQVESLVEHRAVFVAVEQAGGQRGAEVRPRLQPRHLQRLQRELDAVGAHRHAGGAQHAPEVHHVLGQAVHRGRRGVSRAQRCRATAAAGAPPRRPAPWRCRPGT
ncbi:hypothetical protein [Aquincola sp. J276]|uniref:hypothetical protein n=1 Tax=Aquincola sp. J276 TaxID=2898432 RepID=UPI00385718D5|nr:hypothetical protein [Aquincola sp. J276]